MKTFASLLGGAALMAGTLGLALAPAPASAQDYPSQPIHLIVPFSPGGATDLLARVVAEALQQRVGQPVVVENRAGSSGIVAAEYVARAEPDGYTLFFAYPGAITVNPAFYDDLPYDPVESFAPVSHIGDSIFVLAIHPGLEADNLEEFLALARQRPGELNYGHAGGGSTSHLTMEMLLSLADIEVQAVPFRGAGQITPELMAGRLDAGFMNVTTTVPLIEDGSLRALGVSGTSRSTMAPDIPTLAEAGLPDYNVTGWFAVLATAGTPQDVIDRLSSELQAIVADDTVRERMLDMGLVPVGSGPDELAALIEEETGRWARLVEEAGLTIE